MRLYEIGTRKIRTHACPSLQPSCDGRSPSPPIAHVWTFATPAFNRTVTRHDTVSFSIFRLLIRLSRNRPREALHRDAAATVQRMNEQPHWQRSRP